MATDLSKEERGLEDDEAFCCCDPEVAAADAAATWFAVLEGEGFSLIFSGPRNSQLPNKLVKERGILQDYSIRRREQEGGAERALAPSDAAFEN